MTADLERCSRAAAQVTRDLELFSSSEDENEWDPTGKSIEEILAFLKNGRENAVIQTVLASRKNMLRTKNSANLKRS